MRDVRAYFKNFPEGDPALAGKTGSQLARSGIDDMDMLCELLASHPEKVSGIRNIGPKSMAFIRGVCAFYCGGTAKNPEKHAWQTNKAARQ